MSTVSDRWSGHKHRTLLRKSSDRHLRKASMIAGASPRSKAGHLLCEEPCPDRTKTRRRQRRDMALVGNRQSKSRKTQSIRGAGRHRGGVGRGSIEARHAIDPTLVAPFADGLKGFPRPASHYGLGMRQPMIEHAPMPTLTFGEVYKRVMSDPTQDWSPRTRLASRLLPTPKYDFISGKAMASNGRQVGRIAPD